MKKELKTGIITVIAIALFIWGYNFMKNQEIFGSSRVYKSKFDNAMGLSTSSVVTLNGLKVGNITKIENDLNKKGSFIITYSVNNDLKFSKNSIAQISPPTIPGFGSAELVITPEFEGENAPSGTFLQSKTKSGALDNITSKLNPISTKLDKVLQNVNELVGNLNHVLDTNTQNNLKQSFAKLNSTLTSFKSASNSLNLMLTENKDKLGSVLTNADQASLNLKSMTDNFAKANLSNDLKTTVTKLNTTLKSFDSVLSKVNDGNGSVAKLLNDKGLYTNLENASKELEELLREMKEHPKRFVHFSLFGKKDKGYKQDSIK